MAHAKLEGLDLEVLHARKSEKWHTYPPDILPAWVAEMDFPLAAPIERVLREAIDRWDVGYPIAPNATGLREAFAARMDDRFGWSVDPTRVEILTEVVQGMFVALYAYANAGQGVVVQTPIYAPFLSSVEETDRRLVENRLIDGADRWEIDWDGLESGIDTETRVLLFCNPHNPTGRVFTRAELERLADVILRHDLVVVSDEIHADLLYDGRIHIPFATLSSEVAARTVTLTSASKSFNLPGLRCALAHFGTRDLQRRFAEAFPRHVRGGMGILGIYATIAAWRDGQPWLDEVVAYLASNRVHLARSLAERFPDIRLHGIEGTYLAFLDCSALGLGPSPARHFLSRGKVALSDGRVFGDGFEQFVRLNFATSREILDQVLDRMGAAL
jgi:cystathionine beta-lyase